MLCTVSPRCGFYPSRSTNNLHNPVPSPCPAAALAAKSRPNDEQRELYSLDVPRKRLVLGDIPATDALVMSWEGAATPQEPVWDPAGYLERNAPRYDLRPSSPYYHWLSWMQENLPAEQQKLLISFDEHMQDNEKRAYLLKHVKHVSGWAAALRFSAACACWGGCCA